MSSHSSNININSRHREIYLFILEHALEHTELPEDINIHSFTIIEHNMALHGMTYVHKHKLTFLPHVGKSTLHRLPGPTLTTVPRVRVMESKPSEKNLQQCLDRRCWLRARRDVHSDVQRDTAMGPSVKWISRKTGALRSPGLRSFHQYN